MKNKQNKLPIDLDQKRKQVAIDGSKTIKQSVEKEIQSAADLFFSKKEELSLAKSNYDKAAEELLCVMGAKRTDMAVVFAPDGYKRTITVKTGAERLQVEKTKE